MSQQMGDWQDFRANPPVETYPLAYYSVYAIAFSGSQFLEMNHNAATQDAWPIGPRSILSWYWRLSPSAHRGASFIIHVFPNAEGNPAASTNVWRVYKLSSGVTAGIPGNVMSGLQLPNMYCYFELQTAEVNLTVDGYLKLEAPA